MFTRQGLKVCATVMGILALTAFFSDAARLPAAICLALVLTVPVATRMRDRGVEAAVNSRRWTDPSQAVRFDCLVRRCHGMGRLRWRQVRCVLTDAELATVSYWGRDQTPARTSIKGSRIVAVTSSRAPDGLKAGVFQVIHLELADGSILLLAVDRFTAVAVEGALRAQQ